MRSGVRALKRRRARSLPPRSVRYSRIWQCATRGSRLTASRVATLDPLRSHPCYRDPWTSPTSRLITDDVAGAARGKISAAARLRRAPGYAGVREPSGPTTSPRPSDTGSTRSLRRAGIRMEPYSGGRRGHQPPHRQRAPGVSRSPWYASGDGSCSASSSSEILRL
jgi:hypothetical protein